MVIQRFIPDKDSIGLYRSFIRGENGSTDVILDSSNYLLTVQKYELELESYLIDVLRKLAISASVKTNRYSLPHDYEIAHTQKRSGLNFNSFDLHQFVRQVLTELLTSKVKKLRFYTIGDLILENRRLEYKSFNSVNIKFRYTIHEKFDN
jgi:hypothetical protein